MDEAGWVGDWSTFHVGAKYDICLHSKPDCTVVEMEEMDVNRPVFFRYEWRRTCTTIS